MVDGITLRGEPDKTNDPLCIGDVVWLLTRPPGFTSQGLGKSLAEASRMSFAEIENLMRAPDDRGGPSNPQVAMLRIAQRVKDAREARESMQAQIDAAEKMKRG